MHLEFNSVDLHHFIKNPKLKFKDSLKASKYIGNLRLSAVQKGYLLASIDSAHYSKDKGVVYFHLGEKFKTLNLTLPEDHKRFIFKNTRYSEKLINKIPLTPFEYTSVLQKIQESFLNNGYPFVKIQLAKTSFEQNSLNADLVIDTGPLLLWKKINIKGDSSISEKYLSNLLGIRTGQPYNEALTRTFSQKINAVPFVKETKPADFLYTKEGVEVFLYLESIKISAVNGIVGFQPDPLSDKLSVTGELSLKLQNTLKHGELLDLKWQSIRNQTQSLNTKLNYPFLFNTSFGIDGVFDLYKRDTSFLELNSSIGVQYYLNKGNVLKVFFQNISSSVLSGGLNNPTYSNLGSVKSNNYGLSFISSRIDYIPNPSSGFVIEITGSAGNRTSTSSDSLTILKDLTYRGEVNAQFYFPLSQRHVLKLSNRSQFYNAPNIFQNELFRFGGLTNQRGFDEDELVSTTKSSSIVEYRFLLDKNSHVFAFYDQTWYENNSENYYNDSPLGFGIGFSFSTNFGVFSISTALGKQFDNPILIRDSKVHFGYIVYF
ncbi:MAG: hypothetical protein KC454_05250 [Flavobacteriales bacterium]|nr:hypothetical protein [Flavobacteriales bacterium]